ncbi:MAG: SUMF1/EgtB/PvdO family nonheme iron enzyme [Deltaproteobacteria bacterium]|nr:SUMF1/EgtB/PvdO family nonheme iron enzyme [Deltaproteobacteria bacterium]
MQTKPYSDPKRSSSPPVSPEPLPMGWAGDDGRTLPAPPAFGTVLPAPPPPRAPGGSMRGVVFGALAAVAVIGGVGAYVALAPADDGGSSRSMAAAAMGTPEAATGPIEAPAATSSSNAEPAAPAPASPCPDGMTLVEGGKFYMGTDADDAVLAAARPAHRAEVTPFCIDIHEVTVAAYRGCSTKGECKRAFRDSRWPQGSTDDAAWKQQMAAHSELCNENYDDRGEHPINCIDWAQAQHFCEWRGGTLPSEAQWEFAARGSDGRVYSWGDALPSREHMNGAGPEYVAWRERKGLPAHGVLYDTDDGFIGTAPVGSAKLGRSQQGLFDLAGNVFEWTADAYAPYPGADAPADADAGKRRVIRGGAFNSFQPQFADPALRFPQDADAHAHGIGFRCAAAPRA